MQAVASKLHGVEVDIKIIKRKGDPIVSTLDAENNCKYYEPQQTRNCTGNKYDTNINNNNNNNTQVPSNEKCKPNMIKWNLFSIAHSHSLLSNLSGLNWTCEWFSKRVCFNNNLIMKFDEKID